MNEKATTPSEVLPNNFFRTLKVMDQAKISTDMPPLKVKYAGLLPVLSGEIG